MAYDPKAPLWNVMTRTRAGTVSLMKNLTEDEARGLMQRLRRPFDRGDPWSDWNMKEAAAAQAARERFPEHRVVSGGGSGVRFCSDSDGDLAQVDCWGPPGKTLDVWPKPRGCDAKYAKALAAARAAFSEDEATPPPSVSPTTSTPAPQPQKSATQRGSLRSLASRLPGR